MTFVARAKFTRMRKIYCPLNQLQQLCNVINITHFILGTFQRTKDMKKYRVNPEIMKMLRLSDFFLPQK